MIRLLKDSPLLVAALAMTLLLSAQSAGAAISEEYVALGDSAASGNGTGNPNLDPFCYKSSDAYAPIIAKERVATTLKFVACQGAQTGSIVNGQAASVSKTTRYVTLSIGGNDIGFADLIFNCTNSWDEPQCLSTINTVNNRIYNELPAKLDQAYAAIKSRAGANTVVMHVGYPRFFGPNISCSQAQGASRREADALNGVADNLDYIIGQRAARAGVTYVSVIAKFTGHDVCATQPYVNGKYAFNPADIFHPTKAGYRYGFMPLIRAIMG